MQTTDVKHNDDVAVAGGATVGFVIGGPLGLALGAGIGKGAAKIRRSFREAERRRSSSQSAQYFGDEKSESESSISTSDFNNFNLNCAAALSSASRDFVQEVKESTTACTSAVSGSNPGCINAMQCGQNPFETGDGGGRGDGGGEYKLPDFQYTTGTGDIPPPSGMFVSARKDNGDARLNATATATATATETAAPVGGSMLGFVMGGPLGSALGAGIGKGAASQPPSSPLYSPRSQPLSPPPKAISPPSTSTSTSTPPQQPSVDQSPSPRTMLENLVNSLSTHIYKRNTNCVLTKLAPIAVSDIFKLNSKGQTRAHLQNISSAKSDVFTVSESIFELAILGKTKENALLLLSEGIMDTLLFYIGENDLHIHDLHDLHFGDCEWEDVASLGENAANLYLVLATAAFGFNSSSSVQKMMLHLPYYRVEKESEGGRMRVGANLCEMNRKEIKVVWKRFLDLRWGGEGGGGRDGGRRKLMPVTNDELEMESDLESTIDF